MCCYLFVFFVCFFKQKTAYEMRISDWSSDVCSSDLIVYLFMAGGPSQFETFDYKPKFVNLAGQDLPDSVRNGQRLTGMSASQSSLPMVPPIYTFRQHGKTGTCLSALIPHTARVVDELCIINSLPTGGNNHYHAITFFQTGVKLKHTTPTGSC